MSGHTRLTYSVVVLVLEACDSFNLAVPMFLGVWTANVVANLFTTSLLDRELRGKQMPFLRGVCPEATRTLKASQIMSQNVVSIQTLADMKSI
jgi:H+/Cl- antiporter ClcA